LDAFDKVNIMVSSKLPSEIRSPMIVSGIEEDVAPAAIVTVPFANPE
jgi:hypothetical protein